MLYHAFQASIYLYSSLITTFHHIPSIVVITSIIVAATASAISSKFGTFSTIGGIIGTSVSAAFLILLGLMNLYILYKLVQHLRTMIKSAPGQEQEYEIKGAGCLFYLFKKMFKLIDRWVYWDHRPQKLMLTRHSRPWKMYPLGVMFGLGFDTSSEVALLGIASIQGAKGTSVWLILISPVLFTGESSMPLESCWALAESLHQWGCAFWIPLTALS